MDKMRKHGNVKAKRNGNVNEWRSCKSKHRYNDVYEAEHDAKMYGKKRGVPLDSYWCPVCNGYHLTSKKFSYKMAEYAYN